MFKERTVFILGAGASMPYGFPSGYKLVTEILTILNDTLTRQMLYDLDVTLRENGNTLGGKQAIINFLQSLSKAVPDSIDDFIEHRQEFLNIGKAMIARTLIPYEREDVLLNRNQNTNWYKMIFEVIRKDVNKLENKQISFITFNYDRSLEHYLFTQLKEFTGLDDIDSIEAMNKIPILHVYGKIGNLPWQKDNMDTVRYYESGFGMKEMISAINQLSVIHEEKNVIENFNKAKDLMDQGERIIFLGYGFHETNNQRLGLDGLSKKCVATSYGMTELEKEKIQEKYKRLIELDYEMDRDIVRFFREWIPLE
jgi:hypothetical protein